MKNFALTLGVTLVLFILNSRLQAQDFDWSYVHDTVTKKCDNSLVPNVNLSQLKLVDENKISVYMGTFYYRRYRTPDTDLEANFEIYENMTNFQYFKAVVSTEHGGRFFLCTSSKEWFEVRDIGFSIDGSSGHFLIKPHYKSLQDSK